MALVGEAVAGASMGVGVGMAMVGVSLGAGAGDARQSDREVVRWWLLQVVWLWSG